MSSKINMYKSNIYTLSLSLIFVVAGCGTTDFDKELAQVDSLQSVLDSTREINNYDTAYYQMLLDSVKRDMALVNGNYPDSVSFELAQTMDYYKTIKKVTTNFLDAYPILVEETKELDKQLNDLKGTLKSGEMSVDSFNVYYNIEKADVERQLAQYNKVMQPFEQMNEWKDSIMNKAQTLVDKAKQIKQEKNKQGN